MNHIARGHNLIYVQLYRIMVGNEAFKRCHSICMYVPSMYGYGVMMSILESRINTHFHVTSETLICRVSRPKSSWQSAPKQALKACIRRNNKICSLRARQESGRETKVIAKYSCQAAVLGQSAAQVFVAICLREDW